MTPERYAKICELFDAVVQRPEAERSTFLSHACGDDTVLRAEVDALLANDDRGKDFLATPCPLNLKAALPTGASPTVTAKAPARPQVAGYELLDELGRGGMGVVYRARQVGLNRTVALKMVLAGGHAGPAELARFRIEAEAVARLQHPNIVQIYEIGEHRAEGVSPPLPFFSLEFCAGGSLASKLNGTPLPPPQAAKLVETLAQAMHVAHQANIVHRDLKPANILIADCGLQIADLTAVPLQSAIRNPQSAIKISDFGLAKKLDSVEGQTHTGVIMGTPSYMAPEQAAGKSKEVGPAADIYALGAILYELLTGRPPFKAATPLDTIMQVVNEEPVPVRQLQSKVPRDLETICLKCLSKEPRKRYTSMAALAEDLRRFQAGEPILARPASRLYQLAKFTKRNKVLVGGTAAVIVALLLGITGTSIGLVRARAAESQALGNLDRATKAEEQLRRDLAESHLRTAKLASQRGDWRTALQFYDASLEAGYADEIDLRLKKVHAWIVLNERRKAQEELDALSRRDDLGKHAGEFLLARGDFALSRQSGREQALQDIRDALAKGLEPADAAYARGLLAEHSLDAVRHFQEALAHDPFHHRAHGALLTVLLFLGRWDECKNRAEALLLLFPEDPSPRIVLLFAAIAEQDSDAVRVRLSEVKAQLGEAEGQILEELIAFLTELVKTMNAVDAFGGQDTLTSPAMLLKLSALAAKFRSDPDLDLSGLGLGFVNLPSLANSWGAFTAAHAQFALGRPEAALAKLEPVLEHHPEGTFFFWHGHIAIELTSKASRDEMPRLLRKTEESYRRASESPCLLPAISRDAHFWAAWAQCILAKSKATPRDPEMHARAVRNVRWLLAEGNLSAAECSTLSGFVLERLEDHDLARALVSEWEQRAPNDLGALRQRARIELSAGACYPALEAANKVLAQKPDDAEAMRYQKEATDRLRAQSKAVGGPSQ